jgi:tetratricopeptide (TPR) repeat protein
MVLACVAGAAGSSHAQVPGASGGTQGNKPAAGAPAATASRAKASLEPLLKQGSEALAAGQIKAAREAFLDAIAIDARNAKGAHGLALCYLYSKETKKATQTFDKALSLSPKPDRALILNAAAAHSADRNNARAAKLIKDYLTANPREADEPMANALGTALTAATPQERNNAFFTQAAQFYETVNKRLEAARPGQKRFGMEWMPAAEAEAKQRALTSQQKQLDMLEQAIATAEEQVGPSEKELERQKDLVRRGEPPGNYYFRRAEEAYNSAVARYQAAVENLERALANIERPKFPEAIALVGMDETKPPQITAVASASNDGGTGSFTVTKPRRGTGRGKEAVAIKPGELKPGGGSGTGTEKSTGGDTTAGGGASVIYEPPKPTKKVRITQYAAAFPVAPDLAVTSASAVGDDATLQLQFSNGESAKGSLVRKDDATGLALIRIEGRKLVPLMLADGFAGGPISCATFPTADLFTPTGQKIAGNATAPKEGAEWTVSLNLHPRVAGCPILSGNKVVGVCVATRESDRSKLPSVSLAALKQFIGEDVKPASASGDPLGNLLQLVSSHETE